MDTKYDLTPLSYARPLSSNPIRPGDQIIWKDRTGRELTGLAGPSTELRLRVWGDDGARYHLDTHTWIARDVRVSWNPEESCPVSRRRVEALMLSSTAARLAREHMAVAVDLYDGHNSPEEVKELLALGVSIARGHFAAPTRAAREHTWFMVRKIMHQAGFDGYQRKQFMSWARDLYRQDLPTFEPMSDVWAVLGSQGEELGRVQAGDLESAHALARRLVPDVSLPVLKRLYEADA